MGEKMEEDKSYTMKRLQEIVSKKVNQYDLETIPELRYVDLTTEIGEVGKELLKSSDYGKKQLSKTDSLEIEIGDVLFSLICIANTLNIDLETALLDAMKKYERRYTKKGNIGSES